MIPDQVTIIPAAKEDLAKILEIQKRAFYSEAIIYKRHNLLPLIETIDSMVQDFQRFIYLKAEYNAQIIGSVRVLIKDKTCLIGRLIVEPDHQDQGVGKKLMEYVETEFKDIERFELFTGKKSKKNIEFYTKRGYVIISEFTGEDGVGLVKMEKVNKLV